MRQTRGEETQDERYAEERRTNRWRERERELGKVCEKERVK